VPTQILHVLRVASESLSQTVGNLAVLHWKDDASAEDLPEERGVLNVRVDLEVAEKLRGGFECRLFELPVVEALAELCQR